MANSGWDGQLQEDRFQGDGGGCFGTGSGSAPRGEWYDIRPLVCPSTVGMQHRRGGWSPLETPVNNSGGDLNSPDPDLRKWRLPTGTPDGSYNTAAEQGLST